MNVNKNIFRNIKQYVRFIHETYFLRTLKHRARAVPRNQPGEIAFKGLRVTYIDMLSFYTEYKDIFRNRIYHVEANTSTPYIIDGGGGIGMSALYFKMVYPEAKILCFEPDENIFKILQSNIAKNRLNNVELIQAGLAGSPGKADFLPDGADGGKIINGQGSECSIRTVCLSEYLTKPVDFLKLNIEGQELPVLLEAESSGRLSQVRELILEYHGWADGEQRLGPILNLLDRNGFRYLVHDFDAETCNTSKPPFRWTPDTTWFCLVYAQKVEHEFV